MKKNLLIVESPAKAVTIKKYLGPSFDVKASVGHVMDLPKNALGVNVESGFEPHYEVIKGKEKVIKELKQAAKSADEIYLAPDPDREGEAIAWHIAEQVGNSKPLHRVLFHELTHKGIEEAMKNVTSLDRSRYESQKTRRILDRLVGYQISPLLWGKVRTGLSAGRVQSVAVRLVVEREREIQRFDAEEYWSVTALLDADVPPGIEASLLKHKGKTLKIGNGEDAARIKDELQAKPYIVKTVTRKKRSRNPEPPFKTSTLQQEGIRRLRFTAKKTMAVAQALYEGVEVGDEGQVGLITYMRTDSVRIADDAQREALHFIEQRFGKEYVPAKPNVYVNKKNAQDAHEGIRPTSIERDPESVKPFLNADQYRLYTLVWERFLASQMKAALIDQTSVDIVAGDYLFRATGSVVVFPGFMKLYVESTDDEKSGDNGDGGDESSKKAEKGSQESDKILPPLEEGQELALKDLVTRQHFTKPPARYTEATLVKELEEKGIGRPSTYAAILSNIQDRDYVNRDRRVLFPTELGYLVNDLLVVNFPDILNVFFTAQMEERLDDIEEGKASSLDILQAFYGPFSDDLKKAADQMQNAIPTDIKCDKCSLPMAIKWGKNGGFLACTGYPECRNTKDYTRDEKGNIQVTEQEAVQETCPQCGREMVAKKGRFGPFLACSGYPECKYTRPIKGDKPDAPLAEPEPTGEKCSKCGGNMVIRQARTGTKFISCENYPKCKNAKSIGMGVPCPLEDCNGEISERASKRGRRFYGCTNYPKCKFVSWYPPVAQKCPECGSTYLLKKETKRDGSHLACPTKGCPYKEPLRGEGEDAS